MVIVIKWIADFKLLFINVQWSQITDIPTESSAYVNQFAKYRTVLQRLIISTIDRMRTRRISYIIKDLRGNSSTKATVCLL